MVEKLTPLAYFDLLIGNSVGLSFGVRVLGEWTKTPVFHRDGKRFNFVQRGLRTLFVRTEELGNVNDELGAARCHRTDAFQRVVRVRS